MFKLFLGFSLIIFFSNSILAQEQTFNKTYDAKKKVELKVTSGDCIVETGSNDEILVDVKYNVEPEGAFKPDIRESGNSLKIKERWSGSSRGRVMWKLTVPEQTEIRFSSASGDVEITGVKNEIEASTASGDVNLKDVSGEIECSTASGEVTIESSKGEFDISTASGDVEASNVSGEFDMSTASGEIKIDDASGIFELSCASGEIEARDISVKEEGSFSTASGDVEVKLAESSTADLSLSAASGDVTLDYNGNELQGYFELSTRKDRGRISAPYDFETENEIERHGKTYIRKTFKRGGSTPVVTLSTSTGKATIKK
jgi:DUF4097 and DUF4098 domain-containing protein YvlB